MEKEIDETILKMESTKDYRKLSKKILKEFQKRYPNDLARVKEFQQDYALFIKTWEKISDR